MTTVPEFNQYQIQQLITINIASIRHIRTWFSSRFLAITVQYRCIDTTQKSCPTKCGNWWNHHQTALQCITNCLHVFLRGMGKMQTLQPYFSRSTWWIFDFFFLNERLNLPLNDYVFQIWTRAIFLWKMSFKYGNGCPHMRTINQSISCIALRNFQIALMKSSRFVTNAWFVFSSRQHEMRQEWECEGYIQSCLSHSRPVLVSSQSSRKDVSKSLPSQRKFQFCLVALAQECECLHSCIPRLVHISPKVSTSAFDESVYPTLWLCDRLHGICTVSAMSHEHQTRSSRIAVDRSLPQQYNSSNSSWRQDFINDRCEHDWRFCGDNNCVRLHS